MKFHLLTLLFSVFYVLNAYSINFQNEDFEDAFFSTQPFSSISESQASRITELDLSWSNIEGDISEDIKYFTGLKTLDISNNDITAVDLSLLTELESLNCRFNDLETLDLSKNTKLKSLVCDANYYLISPDISMLTDLEKFQFGTNFYVSKSEVDLSKNINLKTLFIQQSTIDSLDLSNNTKLESVLAVTSNIKYVKFGLSPNLTEVSINNNELEELDIRPLVNLTSLDISSNSISTVCVLETHATTSWNKDNSTTWSTECEPITSLSVKNQDIIQLEAYPNPVENTLYLTQTVDNWSIYTISGIEVLSDSKETSFIPVHQLSDGTYILELEKNGTLLKKSFVK